MTAAKADFAVPAFFLTSERGKEKRRKRGKGGLSTPQALLDLPLGGGRVLDFSQRSSRVCTVILREEREEKGREKEKGRRNSSSACFGGSGRASAMVSQALRRSHSRKEQEKKKERRGEGEGGRNCETRGNIRFFEADLGHRNPQHYHPHG